MHRLVKIRIVRDCEFLEERVRRLVDHLFEIEATPAGFRPPVDFYETPQGLVLMMEVAGVSPEDLSLSLDGRELVIRGLRRASAHPGPARFFHHEIACGPFERRFFLPIAVAAEDIEARYADGILKITLPRQRPKFQRITVKTESSPKY